MLLVDSCRPQAVGANTLFN